MATPAAAVRPLGRSRHIPALIYDVQDEQESKGRRYCCGTLLMTRACQVFRFRFL